MTEQKWMDANLNGRTWEWQELVRSGRASLEDLEEGPLKKKLDVFLSIEGEIQKMLNDMGYEAG